jgi:hypothetical protein
LFAACDEQADQRAAALVDPAPVTSVDDQVSIAERVCERQGVLEVHHTHMHASERQAKAMQPCAAVGGGHHHQRMQVLL